MANFVTVRVGGVWAGNSVLLSTEMAEIDSRWPKLINATDGSTHAPTNPIIIGGAGLNVTGPTDIDGALDQDAASLWLMNGQVRFLDNSLLDMRVSSTQIFRTGSLLQVLSGADVDIYGNATWQSGNWPLVTSRTVPRCEWRIASVTYGGTAPDSPRAWLETTLDGPAIKTDDATSAHYFFVELLDLPDGGTLDSVTIRTQGVAGNSSLTLPEYTLYRWGMGTTPLPLGDVVDAHNPVLWSDNVNTTLTPDSPVTIDRQYHYGVQVRAPYHASVAASMYVYDFQSSITIEQLRG
jgi:hypothetical protein